MANNHLISDLGTNTDGSAQGVVEVYIFRKLGSSNMIFIDMHGVAAEEISLDCVATAIEMPEDEDTGSFVRFKHLILRMAYSARAGYPSYMESEKTLDNTKPLNMSRLTKRLLSSIEIGVVKGRRKDNFKELSLYLDKFNKFKWDVGTDMVPLCYPLLLEKNVDKLREVFSIQGIFIPTYWPDIESIVAYDSLEYRLLHHCLFVPCDQRYTTSEMNNVALEISTCLEDDSGYKS